MFFECDPFDEHDELMKNLLNSGLFVNIDNTNMSYKISFCTDLYKFPDFQTHFTKLNEKIRIGIEFIVIREAGVTCTRV